MLLNLSKVFIPNQALYKAPEGDGTAAVLDSLPADSDLHAA